MKKKPIVPSYPEPFVIDQQIQKNFDGWVSYLKNLSPRLKLMTPNDEKFTFDEYERLAKIDACRSDDEKDINEAVLHGWPKIGQVAFIVSFDSSLPGHQKIFLLDDTYLFCYGDIAFGLRYFSTVSYEVAEDEWRFETNNYSLEDYHEEVLSWSYIAKLIKDKLEEIEKQVPLAPDA